MSEYAQTEEELRRLIIENMAGFDENVVKNGDIGTALSNAFRLYANDPKFCVINLMGGSVEGQPTFTSNVTWQHVAEVDFYIPMLGDSNEVEIRTRSVYDAFLTTIGNNSKCFMGTSGKRKRIVVTRALTPKTTTASSQHFILLEFVIHILEEL